MAYRGLKRLQPAPTAYARGVIIPSVLWSFGALVLAGVTSHLLREMPHGVRIFGGLFSVGVVFMFSLTRLVLSAHERGQVRHKCFSIFTRLLPAR